MPCLHCEAALRHSRFKLLFFSLIASALLWLCLPLYSHYTSNSSAGLNVTYLDQLFPFWGSRALPPPAGEGHVTLQAVSVRRQVTWCHPTAPIAPLVKQEFRFLSSDPSNKDLLAYSAYFDQRRGGNLNMSVVRVVGIVQPSRVSTGLLCQLWYRRLASVMVAVPAAVEVVPEGEGRRYESALLACESPDEAGEEAPYAVSLARSACDQPHGALPVVPLPAKPVRNGRIAVCLSPLHLNYGNVDDLVQSLELNRLFGADWFFMYNHSSSQRVTELLSNGRLASDVTIIPFHPPVNVDTRMNPPNFTVELKYFGQMAMLQDCTMRSSSSFEFAVFTDLDEFIVPRDRRYRTWRNLIQARMSEDNGTAGLSFQNAFYGMNLPNDSTPSASVFASRLRLSALTRLRREGEPYPHGTRSKLIVRPHSVRVIGVHNVWQYFNKSERTAFVEFNVAGLHHYRDAGADNSSVHDPTVLRYENQLVARALRTRTVLGLPVT